MLEFKVTLLHVVYMLAHASDTTAFLHAQVRQCHRQRGEHTAGIQKLSKRMCDRAICELSGDLCEFVMHSAESLYKCAACACADDNLSHNTSALSQKELY